MGMFLTPKWWLSHLFVLTMIVVMTAAGFWQLNRLDERRASNDEIRAASEASPTAIEEVLDRIDGGEDVLDHTAVIVEGEYLDGPGLLVANRTFDTQPGFWFVSPVELADGRVVAVSRGWVPRDVASGEGEQSVVTPAGSTTVVGRAFDSVGGGAVGDPVAGTPQVNRMDLDAVADALGVDVVDRWVQAVDPSWQRGDVPIPVPPPNLNDGPHLSYAFQWFFFTTSTIIAYALILRHRLRDARIEELEVRDLLGGGEPSTGPSGG